MFKFDYKSNQLNREFVYQIQNQCEDFPNFGYFNQSQNKFIITSSQDCLYVDTEKNIEIDLDEQEMIANIQNIMSDEERFYVFANKKEGRLGYYLFSIDIDDPEKEPEYFINWTNKLDIANCDLSLLKERNAAGQTEKSIVMSFKSIGINTYNVVVIDIKTKQFKYWHEGYQLWESPVKGFLLQTNDFLILSKDGINLLALGWQQKKVVKDQEGFDRMIHPLSACNALRIEETNHIYFGCQYYDNRQVVIQEQFSDQENQTNFVDIFRIKIWEITLRELLIL